MRSLLISLVLLLAACAPSAPPEATPPPTTPAEGELPEPAPEAGTDRTLEGTVTALDFEPMTYDGDGVVTVRTDAGEEVRVLIPARYGICAAEFDDWDGLAVGDRIAVRGAVDAEGAVRPCERAEHYVRR